MARSPGRCQSVPARPLRFRFVALDAKPIHAPEARYLANESPRVWSVFSYLIIYRPETKPVQILHVIRGTRDAPNAIDDDA